MLFRLNVHYALHYVKFQTQDVMIKYSWYDIARNWITFPVLTYTQSCSFIFKGRKIITTKKQILRPLDLVTHLQYCALQNLWDLEIGLRVLWIQPCTVVQLQVQLYPNNLPSLVMSLVHHTCRKIGVNLHVLFVFYVAACECNNHADSCTYNETKGYGVCDDCKHNTVGDNCELCKVSFYRNAAVPQNDSNTCLGKFTVLTKQPFV